MDNRNSVSIIITTRNEEKTISILLEALLRQTYKYEEIVINDNGSTDETVNIINSFREKHSNIRLVQSGGKSIGEGRHTAMENSVGDILAILDAGMCPREDWLERIVTPLLENREIDVVWGHVIFDTKSRIVPLSDLAIALVFLTKYPEKRCGRRNIPSSAYRRRVWEKLGGFPIIRFPIEDLLLRDLIEEKGFNVAFEDDAIVYYFNYPTSKYEAFKKWVTSACSAFLVRKTELGFHQQFITFGLFFLFASLLLVDIRLSFLIVLYMIWFFASKYRLNKDVGKRIFRNPNLFITTLNLFFILNFARLIGVLRGILLVVSGKQPQIIHRLRPSEEK